MFKIIDTKPKDICVAYRCKNTRKTRDRFCSKHRHRYNKHNNPIKYTYDALRSNAARRNKFFDLTIKEFRLFCEETGYMKLKGKTASSASIDRKNPDLGYTYSNLQVLTLSQNSSKAHSDAAGYDEDLPF